MTKHKSTHGGAREGAGRKPKDPEAPRIMWSGRLHPRTLAALKRYATAARSQGEIIDEAVRSWAARRRKS